MSKDTIYRQDAIDAFKKELTVGESKGNYVTICSAIGYEGAKQILENLPSTQPELVNDSPELNKLFEELKEKYEWAKRQEWIFNPLGYALYYVWKEYDERGELL